MPRLIVAVDEANATLHRLARYWETFRQKDDPKTSPAIAALEMRSGSDARPASTSSSTDAPSPPVSQARLMSCSPR